MILTRARQPMLATLGWAAALTGLLVSGCAGSSSTGGATGSGASSSAGSTAPATPARKLTVLLDWFPNPDHVSLYVAQQQGFFKAAGLDVTLQAPSDPTDPPKLVSTGKVDLGISYEPEMFFSRVHGLDVTAVAALIPTALNSVIAVGKSPVKSAADLGRRTVGNSGAATDNAFLRAICQRYRVDVRSVKNVTVKTSLVEAMIAGNVDATIGGYRNVEAVQLAAEGYHPVVMPVTDAGVPNYDELVVIANGHKLTADPGYAQLVRDFLAALAKGAQKAQSDPAAAQAALKGVAKDYNPKELPQMIAATLPLLSSPAGFEAMDRAQWDSFGAYLRNSGLIDRQVTAAEVMTTDFLPRG
jgi:putative hydroxymethylpyrimidine transport system substrate-binding protein